MAFMGIQMYIQMCSSVSLAQGGMAMAIYQVLKYHPRQWKPVYTV